MFNVPVVSLRKPVRRVVQKVEEVPDQEPQVVFDTASLAEKRFMSIILKKVLGEQKANKLLGEIVKESYRIKRVCGSTVSLEEVDNPSLCFYREFKNSMDKIAKFI